MTTIARDWTKTLFNASYKGVPFFVEVDSEPGRRRIVEHEFPMRDDPFLEDLGEGVRRYNVTAYLASDTVDTDAATLMTTCATRGPGVLVLPMQGPLTVRCKDFERSRHKDKAGYVAFDLHFVREGLAFAVATVASLANTVFVQADNLAAAAIANFAATAQVLDQPSFVSQAAIDGMQNNASVLEAIRTSYPVDPTVSAAQGDTIQSIFDDAPDLAIAPDPGATPATITIPTSLFAAARAIGEAMPATNAISAFDAAFDDATVVVPAPTIPTPSNLAEVANQNLTNDNMRLMALTAYAEAIASAPLSDRPTAITLRANVAEYFEEELLTISADNINLAHAVMTLRDSVVDYLSRAIIDLSPVITVTSNAILPSLFWAHRLYQDATRAMDIVNRNKLPHPSFVPTTFEALAR